MTATSGSGAVRAAAAGAVAAGAAAAGALAVGALAIGLVEIGRIVVGHAHVRVLRIDRLEVGEIVRIGGSRRVSRARAGASPGRSRRR